MWLSLCLASCHQQSVTVQHARGGYPTLSCLHEECLNGMAILLMIEAPITKVRTILSKAGAWRWRDTCC